jgi:tRNA 5-methylaminomethyl-2-thiouridine biosynthesis bifunctional protein
MRRSPQPPRLEFDADGAPAATAFGDVYFSKAGGLAESDAVFLAGCDLPAAWAGRENFAIGELGFGAGLNFLATLRAWREHRSSGARLDFVSVEAFPLSRDQAARALLAFPEIAADAARLVAQWPVIAFGPQRLWFAPEGVTLTVIIEEAAPALERLRGRFDAWYLDGFAPARNPAMWTPAVLARVAALSASGARAATYSTAGTVRRGLESAGFAVAKRPGFARKRERLEAVASLAGQTPAPTPPRTLAILGAGIAGAHLAAAARRHGLNATLYDAADSFGAGASGNPLALVMPRLDRAENGASRLFRAAYLAALAAYAGLGGSAFAAIGVVEQARPGREAALAALLADPPLPDAMFTAHAAGAHHLCAGVVRPHSALPALVGDAPVHWGASVARLERDGDGWRLLDAAGDLLGAANAVVIANGPGLARFAQTAGLAVGWSAGQVEWGDAPGLGDQPARAGGPYGVALAGTLLFGATFSPQDDSSPPAVSMSARAENLRALAGLAPEWAGALNPDALRSRASVRAVTPDRLPIAGPAPDFDQPRGRDALADPLSDLAASAHPGLYVLGGLGARGFVLAPILAEQLISVMLGKPWPLDSEMAAAVHPARFQRRALRKGEG